MHPGAVVVAESAVQASERGFVVYVVEKGRARQQPVAIGSRTGEGAVEILSGLRAGDTIVTEGSDRLTDGMAVEAVKAVEAVNAKDAKDAKDNVEGRAVPRTAAP